MDTDQVKHVTHERAARRDEGSTRRRRVGLLDRLQRDHADLRIMFFELERTSNDDRGVRRRRALLPSLRNELLAHLRAEERTLFASLKRYPEVTQSVANRTLEHEHLETLLRSLEHVELTSRSWPSALFALRAGLEHHINASEQTLFIYAEHLLSPEQLTKLGLSFRSERLKLLQQITPTCASDS